MDHLSVLQSNGILKNANSYILTNRERSDLIDSFYNLAKINKIDLPKKANFNPHTIGLVSKNLTLKEMINLSLTNKKMRETMIPIIEDKKRELRELKDWLSNLPNPKNYTIEQLDQETMLFIEYRRLTSIPNINLPKLESLYLYNNKLRELPNFNLPNLELLDISNNKLTSINLDLPNLQTLYLYSNKFTSIPKLNLPKLLTLDLRNNPLPETEKAKLRSIYGDKLIEDV